MKARRIPYHQDGKRWMLPGVLKFSGHSHHHLRFKVVGFQIPRIGEYFISFKPPRAIQQTEEGFGPRLVVIPIIEPLPMPKIIYKRNRALPGIPAKGGKKVRV